MKFFRFTQPYVCLAQGFVYLVAIIDWYSRRVLAWRLSNTMEMTFFVDCLQEALLLKEYIWRCRMGLSVE